MPALPIHPYHIVIDKPSVPRLEEILLATLWIIGSSFWGIAGITAYVQNLTVGPFSLTGFGVAYFFLCLTAFGLRYAGHIVLLIVDAVWKPQNALRDHGPAFTYGAFCGLGALFSLFSIGVVLSHILARPTSDNTLAPWVAIVIIGLMLAIGFGCTIIAVTTFEPYMANSLRMRMPGRLLSKRLDQPDASATDETEWQALKATGPLVREVYSASPVLVERPGGRKGLRKSVVFQGSGQIGMLGFTVAGHDESQPHTTLFASSAGTTIRFAAGGRKGHILPPAFAFWDVAHSDRLQTARLDAPQVFLTRNYRVPPIFDSAHFLVPANGGRFAWVSPEIIRVGSWHSDSVQSYTPETSVLRPQHGFTPFAFSPDASRLAWADAAGSMRCWNLDNERVHPLRAFPGEVWGLTFSADSTKIAAVGNNGVLLQNIHTGWRWFMACDPSQVTPTALAISPAGVHLALALQLADGRMVVRVVNLFASRYFDLPDSPALSSALLNLCFSPDNRYLAGVDADGILHLWDIRAGNEIAEAGEAHAGPDPDHHTPVPMNAIHGYGSGALPLVPQRILGPELALIALSAGGRAALAERARVDLGSSAYPAALAFSADGATLITGCGNRLSLWDVAALCLSEP